MTEASGICRACGRPLGARADRAAHQRVYCSKRCARQRVGPYERRVEQAIQDLLAARGGRSSICPTESAREIGGDGWRDRLEDVRRAARRLAARGVVEITQRGRVIDAATARGAIRIRLARNSQ